MTSLNDRRVLILAVVAIVLTGTFDAGLLIPTLLHVSSPSADFTYLLIALFVGSIASAFAIFPIVIYLYRRTVRLQDAVNHYIRNRMQEIISTLDVLQNEIEPHLSDKQKAEMISNVRQICYRVANTLPQRIMIEAPNFDHNIAKDNLK